MQMLAVVGKQPPKLATRGDVRALEEASMFDDDPRWGDTRERDDDPRDLDATIQISPAVKGFLAFGLPFDRRLERAACALMRQQQ